MKLELLTNVETFPPRLIEKYFEAVAESYMHKRRDLTAADRMKEVLVAVFKEALRS